MSGNYKFALLGILFSVLVGACGSREAGTKYHLDYIPFENEDKDDDAYGLLGQDGTVLSKTFAEWTTPAVNGYFAMEEEDGYTICKINEDSFEKLPNATDYAEVGVMNDGLIPVCKDGEHIQVLDENGNVKFSLKSVDGVEVWNCYSYSCGKMRVELNNGTVVYIDGNGNNIFNKTYEWATDFDCGYAVVGVGDDKYQLINNEGEDIFSFVCDDPESIVFSSKYQKLSAKDDNDICTVYGFDGKFTYLPKMVEEVYALLEDEFIFKTGYCYGLMSYEDCRDKIYAKYDQLVPNGKYYLGIHTDNDEIVQLLDSNGTQLATFDGDEIFSPAMYGFDFPNIIKRPDNRLFLVNDKGEMIGHAENFEIDMDDIIAAPKVHNHYFPYEKVDDMLLSLCGYGNGVPNGSGAFFSREGSHCHTYEIAYFNNSNDIERFRGKYAGEQEIGQGVNYAVSLSYIFDEPIVRSNENSLNRSAWLKEIQVNVKTTNVFLTATVYNRIEALLRKKGCTELFSNNVGCVLTSSGSKNLICLRRSGYGEFTITMVQNSGSNADMLKNRLGNSNAEPAK